MEIHLYFRICLLTNHVIDSSVPSASRPGSGHRRSGETKHMATAEKTWFGHPRGLTILFLTQMWEQFSYYGMRSIVVYYMVSDLMMSQARSSMLLGTYVAFFYLTPMPGGLITDTWLGRGDRKEVVKGK